MVALLIDYDILLICCRLCIWHADIIKAGQQGGKPFCLDWYEYRISFPGTALAVKTAVSTPAQLVRIPPVFSQVIPDRLALSKSGLHDSTKTRRRDLL